MCWICDKHASSSNLLGTQSQGALHVGAATGQPGSFLIMAELIDSAPSDMIRIEALDAADGKATDGLLGTGHQLAPPQPPALIVVPDNVAGDTSTTATLTVGAAPIVSTTNTIGDFDFYKVTLTAGQSYEIGMYAKDGGPNGVAHGDAFVEIYGPNGALIVSGDGGASTLRNSVNSGFDVLLSFTPETSGTYYVNARAFDQDPVNGTNGDFVGDYELFVRTAQAGSYKPYYDVNSPLYALDWGSQVDRTSRNPDGQEGPRITGNEFTGVGSNPFGISGKNVITYYFARQGEVFVNQDPVGDPLGAALTTTVAFGMEDWEKAAFRSALSSYEKFADIVFVEVANRNEADFKFITYNGTPNVGILGRMSPPNENQEGQAEFNRNGPGWNQDALVQGGFSYITLIHEVGHGMGLAHPHDNGGRSGIMRGVEAEGVAFDYTTGDFDLNQGIHTMMSYEDGWQTSPYGRASTTANYGWLAGPMAFDIAVLQDKYGVNEDWATGNDTYVLKDANVKGTFYEAIWDAGGTDSIVYSGARNAVIDLRPASLKYEIGGGGFVSYAFGIHGGFTIANGVTIENATGGSGNDVITGNDVANVLVGGAGDDWLDGRRGRDVLVGGAGADTLIGSADAANEMIGGIGNDTYYVTNAGDTLIELASEGRDTVRTILSNYTLLSNFEDLIYGGVATFTGTGNDAVNLIVGGSGRDILSGLGGGDTLLGLAGDDSLVGGSGAANTMQGGTGDDTYYVTALGDSIVELVGEGNDAVVTTLQAYELTNNLEYLHFGGSGDFIGRGNSIANTIHGGAGNDLLNGGLGADVLIGNGGNDTFVFDSALGSGNVDSLTDFATGADRIVLDNSVFAALSEGALGSGAFVVGSAALDTDDRIIYNQTTGALFYDADGSGAGAAIQFAQFSPTVSLAATDFLVV